LEYDSNRVDFAYAWQNVGVDFNRWICGIRSKFGSVSVVRVFESHESGYPHVHALLVFHSHKFEGRSMKNMRGKLIYRVVGSDFNNLKSLVDGANRWAQGYSDFELVNSYRGGIRYLAKYLAKSTSIKEAGPKGVKTLAMCWFFHKRSFGYQGEMFSSDEIGLSTNSNLSDESSSVSSFISSSGSSFLCVGFDLFGKPVYEEVVRWKLRGFIVRSEALWHDKAIFHKVHSCDLELVEQRFSNGHGAPDLFDVNPRVVFSSMEQKSFALSDNGNSCFKLGDFQGVCCE
jgi:hypothetical protein